MPHVIIEYSANLDEVLDVGTLVRSVHRAVLDTGVAAPDALRTRAVSRRHFAIADEHPDNSFVAVVVRLARGRSDDDHHKVLDAVLGTVDEQLGAARTRAMLSAEVQEIDPLRRRNRNHLRDVLADPDR